MKYVDYLVISPSEDLNEIAQKHYHNMPLFNPVIITRPRLVEGQ
ncbi:MAG: hypothetical protein Ct9H300mP4_14880 [Gammaproteobacteria bacterium]|nr:MAG: hypothetical protein Ct9H300mP4_14880 [Gammaproteobacteria bacterium]